MEPFIDGGLFEIFILVLLGSLLNYIFLKKYLLFMFSIVIFIGPVLLFFVPKGIWFDIIASLCLLNSVLLIILLWRERKLKPETPLFNIKFRK